jgi:choline dehydrogenase-like flavoprotein
VRIIDATSNTTYEYYADVIFLNASTIASAFILLHSTSRHFPEGLGNSSGQVGLNLMDHHTRVGASGVFDGYQDQYYSGRRPNGIFVPRFRNISQETTVHNYIRGFNYQADAEREGWMDKAKRLTGFGTDFKQQLTTPGDWTMWMGAWGETLPNAKNKVTINRSSQDKWNLPLVEIDFKFGDNEKQMRKDMQQSAVEMLDAAGFKNVKGFDYDTVGGDCVHEMGTARMGNDPRTSVLNKWNQIHEVPNVFVTDGSCMTSAACQNPSLTYMALTARACNYAVNQLKAGKL